MPLKPASTVTSADCTCVGSCVGLECVKQASATLLALGRPADALDLVTKATQKWSNDTQLLDHLHIVRDTINSAEFRNAQTDSHSDPSSPSEQQLNANHTIQRREEGADFMLALAEHLECIICSKLMYEPVTTACGHSFCRACLSRALDSNDACPICRNQLHLENPSTLAITNVLRNAIVHCFPDEYEIRRKESEIDNPSIENALNRLPLFPLNAVVFPMQSYPMLIFEPRYRLMLRRILCGSRKFGLVALKRNAQGISEFCDVGCVLEVVEVERFPDGRSFIQTIARDRFKVKGRIEVDGYYVARTEKYEDEIGTPSEEDIEVERRARETVNKLIQRGYPMPPIKHALQRAGELPTEAKGSSALGMWLAGILVRDRNERQHILEMQDSAKRLKEMEEILVGLTCSRTETSDGEGRDCCIQ